MQLNPNAPAVESSRLGETARALTARRVYQSAMRSRDSLGQVGVHCLESRWRQGHDLPVFDGTEPVPGGSRP